MSEQKLQQVEGTGPSSNPKRALNEKKKKMQTKLQ